MTTQLLTGELLATARVAMRNAEMMIAGGIDETTAPIVLAYVAFAREVRESLIEEAEFDNEGAPDGLCKHCIPVCEGCIREMFAE